jgi:hypothetical protein
MQGFLDGVARGLRRVFEDPMIVAVVFTMAVVLALLKARGRLRPDPPPPVAIREDRTVAFFTAGSRR